MAKLFFNYGTMNSGKSAQLLMARNNYLEQGNKVLVVKSSIDTRDGSLVKSRALGAEVPAMMLYPDSDLAGVIAKVKSLKASCVLVDEAQFLVESQVDELSTIADDHDVPVICYGLMTDFQGLLFEGSRRLVELGAKLSEIKTTCWDCSSKALFNMRLHNGVPIFEGDQVFVGGNESYRPVCRKCFMRYKSGAQNRSFTKLVSSLH